MTLSYHVFNVMIFHVNLTTKRSPVEPVIRRDFKALDSASIRAFLGADPNVEDLDQKGIFVLEDTTDLTDHIFGVRTFEEEPIRLSFPWIVEVTGMLAIANKTICGCDMCEGQYPSATRGYIRTFLDIITEKGRAAVAFYALYIMAHSTRD